MRKPDAAIRPAASRSGTTTENPAALVRGIQVMQVEDNGVPQWADGAHPHHRSRASAHLQYLRGFNGELAEAHMRAVLWVTG